MSQPMASSFVSPAPIYSSPTPTSTPTPTPTPTPFPSPTSPRAPDNMQHFQWAAHTNSDTEPGDRESYSVSSSSHTRLSADHGTDPLSPMSSSSQDDRSPYDPPHHPPALSSLSSHPPTSASKTFGVLPYPEWRIEVAERAQRAGLGDVGRAMKWALWQCEQQLDLDLEEVQNRHGDDRETTAQIQKKKRETLMLKHRRRSTTSHTSTITEGGGRSKVRAIGFEPELESTTVYDSDVSEDTGRMIDSDSEEGSEAEWQGWMADLHRQHQTQARHKHEEEDELARASAIVAQQASHETDEEMLEPPKTAEEDRKKIRERRMMLEPTAVVTTMYSAASAVPASRE